MSRGRTTVRRIPDKQVEDRATLDAILDAGLVCHVAVVDGADDDGTGGHDPQPYAVACGYARDGDRLLLHGSTGSRLFRRMGEGAPMCVSVTLLDGLVYARSLFESSMHYRGAMVLGRGSALADDEKLAALMTLSEHLMPGRSIDARHPSRKELAATSVIALPLTEWSVKVSNGPPDDDPDDLDRPVWAGTVGFTRELAEPVDAPDLAFDLGAPAYVRHSVPGITG